VFTEKGILRREWEKFRALWISREGGVWRAPAHTELWEPRDEAREGNAEWEHTKQRLGFIAHHVTSEGTVFIDRIQTCKEARRIGIARELMRRAIQGRTSELQVHVRNVTAKRLYESIGYVEMEEGEYNVQRKHQCMKRPEGDIAETNNRNDVEYAVIGTAEDVPRQVWMWFEQLIMENDSCTRRKAQDILKPKDARMTYAIAVLTDGRSDAAGRRLRTVRKLDYKETRTNEPRREENCVLGEDRGRIHNKVKWGWRLMERMVAHFK
jgi:GNAT superfamily N-acetyltransferase